MFGHLTQLTGIGDEPGINLPRVENRLREEKASVARERLLIEVAPVADHAVDRQVPIVNHIPERIAGLEEAGALDEHEGECAAQVQACGDAPRLAFSANANE